MTFAKSFGFASLLAAGIFTAFTVGCGREQAKPAPGGAEERMQDPAYRQQLSASVDAQKEIAARRAALRRQLSSPSLDAAQRAELERQLAAVDAEMKAKQAETRELVRSRIIAGKAASSKSK